MRCVISDKARTDKLFEQSRMFSPKIAESSPTARVSRGNSKYEFSKSDNLAVRPYRQLPEMIDVA